MKEQAKSVLVTGGSIGIGRAACRTFANLGRSVYIGDVLIEEGEALANELTAHGYAAKFEQLDVRDTERTNVVVRAIEDLHGSVGTLVLNAGVAYRVPLSELTDDLWDETFDIDLKAMLRAVRASSRAMAANGGGSVVCVSSVMGTHYGWGEHVHYSSAKAGVTGLVRALAVELAPARIRVNCVVPGYIRTAQILSERHSLGAAGLESTSAYIPLGRPGEPEDIADVIAFLASEGARYITGQTLVVDGGLTVGRC